MRDALLWIQRLLTTTGVCCLGLWTGVTLWARVSAARNEAVLERSLRASRGCTVAAGADGEAAGRAPGAPSPGAVLGRVDLARAGVSAIVLEGTSATVLAQAAGHVAGTALPGEAGNVVIAGHRDSLFRNLRRVSLGEVATLVSPGGEQRYVVDSIEVVRPDDIGVLARSDRPTLTLVTCYPFVYVGAAPLRFVVRAIAEGAERPIMAAADPVSGPPPVGGVNAAPRTRIAAHVAPPERSARPHRHTDAAAPRAKKLHWWQRLFHRRSAGQRSRAS